MFGLTDCNWPWTGQQSRDMRECYDLSHPFFVIVTIRAPTGGHIIPISDHIRFKVLVCCSTHDRMPGSRLLVSIPVPLILLQFYHVDFHQIISLWWEMILSKSHCLLWSVWFLFPLAVLCWVPDPGRIKDSREANSNYRVTRADQLVITWSPVTDRAHTPHWPWHTSLVTAASHPSIGDPSWHIRIFIL